MYQDWSDYGDHFDDDDWGDLSDNLMTNTYIENLAVLVALENRFPGAVKVFPDAYDCRGRCLGSDYIAVHRGETPPSESGDYGDFWRAWAWWKQEIEREAINTGINGNDDSTVNRIAIAMFYNSYPNGSWSRCLYDAEDTIQMFRIKAEQYLRNFKNVPTAR